MLPIVGHRPPGGLPESPLFIARALRPGAINLFNDRVSTYSWPFLRLRLAPTQNEDANSGDGRLMRRFVSIAHGRTVH